MGTVPKDIQDGITKLGEKVGIPVESLVERLKEIIETDESIQAMEKEDWKIRYAWAILYREHSMAGKAEDFFIMPICKPRAREAQIKGETTYVGDMAALIQKIEKDKEGNITLGDVTYAAGTFWRDGAKNMLGLISGRVYKASLIATENSWGMTITSDRTGFIKVKEKMPTFEEFFEKEIKPKDVMISIDAMDLNGSESQTDIRVIEATVIESIVAEKGGRTYGRYLIMDNSVMGANQAIFVAPEDVIWEQGSLLQFGGTINIDEKTSQIRWTNHFILPTDLAEKKEVIIVPIKTEEIDIDLETDKELSEEVEKETKEEPKDEEEIKEKPKEKAEVKENIFEV